MFWLIEGDLYCKRVDSGRERERERRDRERMEERKKEKISFSCCLI